MSRYFSYFNTAKKILQQYKGEEPFSSFLKKFFSAEKKYGSKDRKQIADVCYCYFRLGKAMLDIPFEEKILAGLFLCSRNSNEMLEQLKPEWNAKAHLSLHEKCSVVNEQFSVLDVFPWKNELSEGIEYEKFCESFFNQPDVYLRIRPGNEQMVREKLKKAEINFSEISSHCLVVSAATKIDSVLEFDKEVVVQDLNSQRTLDLLKPEIEDWEFKIKAWDCCAGSGGKSILAYDLIPNIDLTASDARESIIQSLKKRFATAGIKQYKSFVTDLISDKQPTTGNYDLIICDAPCTGSGTWSRTPEQLYFFDEKKIDHYSSLQKKIISNAIPQLNNGGYFLYITCSVFKKENEENVDFTKKQFHLELIKMELLKGYDKKADSLFAALFKKL